MIQRHRSPVFTSCTSIMLVCGVLMANATRVAAQTRERPIAFDSAGRVNTITPPLAARLGLSGPVWPVKGDYIDARLYAIGDSAVQFVIVVRFAREIVERYALDGTQRRSLAEAITRANSSLATNTRADLVSSVISEPVRGSFVVNQTFLGALVFGPAAAAALDDGTSSTAGYLAVTGMSFFLATNLTQTTPVSRAQNHLSWHGALQGTVAADLSLYAFAGDNVDARVGAATVLAGGVAGDVVGFVLGAPMTDAEAHGTTHGATVLAALAVGISGGFGAWDTDGNHRLASALIVGAGALGYPVGLHYVRDAPYRVTAGDVSTLLTTEVLGMGAAATLLTDGSSSAAAYSLITAGFAAGVVGGDRWLVRPFDFTESEARTLQYGGVAGALVGVALPVLAHTSNEHVLWGAATAGGILGAYVTLKSIDPQRATSGFGLSTPRSDHAVAERPRVDVQFTPEVLVLAGLRMKGNYPVVSLTF